jgi:hypothetical protein
MLRAMSGHPIDGVVKFGADHDPTPLPHDHFDGLAGRLLAWRDILVRLGGVGQRADRYGGAGFGNVSARVGPFPGERGRRGFVITGTQTGGHRCMGLDDLCHVRGYDIAANRVESRGRTWPSSESLTHGAVYDLSPSIRCVLHVHAPLLWHDAQALHLPTTDPAVAYGTPQMAHEVGRLARQTALFDVRVFSMGGHEDGIVAFGRDFDTAGAALVRVLARAGERLYAEQHRLCSDATA